MQLGIMKAPRTAAALAILVSLSFWPAPSPAADTAPVRAQSRGAQMGPPGLATSVLTDQPPVVSDALKELRERRLREGHPPGPGDEVRPGKVPIIGGDGTPVEPLEPPPASAVNEADAAADADAGSVAGDDVGPMALPASIVRNTALPDTATNDSTSVIAEPSAAARGNEVVVSGNWFLSYSNNGGASFRYINPDATFPTIAGQRFCCDQLVYYDKSRDLLIWLMQTLNTNVANGPNYLRLAVSRGADITFPRWAFYTFTPSGVGGWTDEWFDFSSIALSNNYLHLTVNSFSTARTFRRAVMLRIPLANLASYSGFSYNWASRSEGSIRPTVGATTQMYLASQVNSSTIRVFNWPDASTSFSWRDRTVEASTGARGTYSSVGPDGRNWLGRVDRRITAGWTHGGTVGFAWTAQQDARFPRPNVRVAMLRTSDYAVTAQPHLWNSTLAFAYPAIATNSLGEIGISAAYGGGTSHPSHTIGFRDVPNNNWRLTATAVGNSGPASNGWGDYFTLQRHGVDATSLVTGGYSLQGGPNNTNTVVRYVQFK